MQNRNGKQWSYLLEKNYDITAISRDPEKARGDQKPKSYTGAKKPFKKSNAKATPKVQVVEKVQFKNGKNK